MNDDLISRKEAITAIQKAYADTVRGMDKCAVWKNVGLTNALHIMQDLPSAQPEQSSEIQDILEYLDTVLHPIISPDHWNVYSELHDMISMLPSAQPEHTETHSCDYQRTVTHEWIPVSEALPPDDEDVIVTCLDDSGDTPYSYTTVAWHYKGIWVCDNTRCLFVTAWLPMPKPWKGNQDGKTN